MTDHEAYYDGWWCMKDPFVSFTSSPINYEDGEKMYV